MTTGSATNRFPITVPDLGSGSDSVRVSAWLVDVGQTVIVGDRVVEVLVPGITFDIEAAQSGALVEVTRPVDAIVAQGDVLGWVTSDE